MGCILACQHQQGLPTDAIQQLLTIILEIPDSLGGRRPNPARDSSPSTSSKTASQSASTDSTPDQPPVTEGEQRRLQIEDVGDQGDGLARVGPGYVVFVPDTEIGQQPLVRITTVRENVAFAEVVEP